jgi:hypothetical protein
MNMDIKLSDYPADAVVTVRDPKRPPDEVKHINASDYDAKRDGAILGKENERGVAINPPASDMLMRKG